MKQTKIPRFESGSASVTTTRIPKPSGLARPIASTLGTSKLLKPHTNGIAKNQVELNATTTLTGGTQTFESSALPRKTILRRFGAANHVQIKGLPRLMSKNPLKSSQLVHQVSNNVRIVNETIELSDGAAVMNFTKPVISPKNTDVTAMDRNLTRSNTFVCDTADDSQVKLLSTTHNVNPLMPPPNGTINQINMQLNKERTFKRSLSPIPGDMTNSAKRKLMQFNCGQKVMSGPPILNSTPRRSMSYSDARKANCIFFGAKSVDLCDTAQVMDQQQTFTFDNITFEQSYNFAPDATKLGKAANSTMQGNRVFDLTQTLVQFDAFYPDNRNAIPSLDANAAEQERKNGDASKSNASSNNVNDADGNLTKTIIGEFNCAPLFYRMCFFLAFLLCNCSTQKKQQNRCMQEEHEKIRGITVRSSYSLFFSLFFSGENATNTNCWFWSVERGFTGG